MNAKLWKLSLVIVALSAWGRIEAAPQIQNVEAVYQYDRGFAVSFETDIPSSSQVEFGIDQNYGLSSRVYPHERTDHSITLAGCEPSTLYHFRIRCVDVDGNESVSSGYTVSTTRVPDFADHTLASTVGTDYPVGPGQLYEEIEDVPWESLAAGDSVRIFWRPTPYLGKILIQSRGTPSAPIRVVGVPGPNGERPILDGKNARTRPELNYKRSLAELSVICIDAPWDKRPGYILIQGLHITGAYSDYEFFNGAGVLTRYSEGAAAIRGQKVDNLVIRNCEISDCSNGLFVLSRPSQEEELSREITIEGNYIHGNSHVGRDREHGSYIQCLGALYQYNRYGALRAESGGSSLKDRSSGTVIRYNWIEGGAHTLDLVEAEDHWDFARRDMRYRETFVYGNILRVGERGTIIHYGGDNGDDVGPLDHFRQGTLYFYHNTLLSINNAWRNVIFDLGSDRWEERVAGHAAIFNNVLFRQGRAKFQLMSSYGSAAFGVNWINEEFEPVIDRDGVTATLTGLENFVTGTVIPFSQDNYLPVTDIIDQGRPLVPEVIAAGHTLEQQINPAAPGGTEAFPMTLIETRPVRGSTIDLGALEAAPPVFTSIRVDPSEANVTEGGNILNFSAIPVDQYGLPIVAEGDVSWQTNAGDSGSVDDNGRFLSGVVGGPFQVTATLNGVAGQAQVEVREPSVLTFLQIEPGTLTLTVGDSFAFSARAEDQFGLAFDVSSNWSVEDGAGQIDENGVFSAQSIGGPFVVTVETGGRSATAQVTVRALPIATSLSLDSENYFVKKGEPFQLEANVIDQFGDVIEGARVEFTVASGGNGTLDSSDRFTAPEEGGPYPVTAAYEGLRAEGTLTVVNKLLPQPILQVWPAPDSVGVPVETSLELLFPVPVYFGEDEHSRIMLFQEGIEEPVWSLDPAPENPNTDKVKPSFPLPTLLPGTTYYVITEWTWVRINQAPWRPNDFLTPDDWSFTTAGTADPYEVWANDSFGSQVVDASIAGTSEDPDADGVVNLVEFSLGSDPMDGASVPRIQITDAEGEDGNRYGIRFQLRRYPGVRCLIRFSRDLVNWQDLAALNGDGSDTVNPNGGYSISTTRRDIDAVDDVVVSYFVAPVKGFYSVSISSEAPPGSEE